MSKLCDDFTILRVGSVFLTSILGRFQEVQKDWFQADRTCQEHDSYLLEIDSSEENAAIVEEIQRIGVGRLGSMVPHAWLGLTQLQVANNWTLMSSWDQGRVGQAPSFVNWGGLPPSHPNCATMKTSNGLWGAADCHMDDMNFVTICEKTGPVKTTRNEGVCATVSASDCKSIECCCRLECGRFGSSERFSFEASIRVGRCGPHKHRASPLLRRRLPGPSARRLP